MNSQDYAIHAIKGIKKSFDDAMEVKIEEYKDNRAIDFYNTTEIFEIFTSTEGITGSKELAETETPPLMKLEEGYSVTITEKRFGSAIILTEKMYRRDQGDSTLKVDTYLTRQRNKALQDTTYLLLTNAFEMYNSGFSSSSAYLAPDGVEVFGAHTWKSGTTFDNGVTAVLSEAAIDAAMEYAGAFTSADGKPMPLNFDTIIVKKGSAASRTARKLFAEGISPTSVADINIYEGELTIIETPYITSANKLNWFLRDSRFENPLKVGIGEYPTMRAPIVESNESVRSNITWFWKEWVVDMPFSLYGSTGVS